MASDQNEDAKSIVSFIKNCWMNVLLKWSDHDHMYVVSCAVRGFYLFSFIQTNKGCKWG